MRGPKNTPAFVDSSGRVWATRQAYKEFVEDRKELTKIALSEL